MRVTIVVADNAIGINGEFKTVVLPDMGGVTAVQWNGVSGHVEFTDGSNIDITSLADYLSILALWGTLPVEPTANLSVNITRAELPSLSAWQVRKVLNATGLRPSVEAQIELADQNTKDAWRYANEFKRDDALLNDMASLIGISQDELDQLFITGAKL